jgi:hypothetical protein
MGPALLAGCYRYTEIRPDAVVVGQEVRVTIDREETLRQADVLGGLRETLTGMVAEESEGSVLALAVPQRGTGFNDFVRLRYQGILRIEEKEFSPGRTAALAAAGAVVAVGVLALVDQATGGDDDDGGINEQMRVPLFRIAW